MGNSVRSEEWIVSDSVGGASGLRDRSCFSPPSVDLLSCGDGRGRFPFEPRDDILRKARCGVPREMFKNGEWGRGAVIRLDRILLVIETLIYWW